MKAILEKLLFLAVQCPGTKWWLWISITMNDPACVTVVGISPGTIVFDIRSSAGVTTENTTDFTVSPNPSNGMINIHGKTANAIVTLTDLNGMMLQSTSNDTLNIETLPAGIYFVNLNGTSQKVIKL